MILPIHIVGYKDTKSNVAYYVEILIERSVLIKKLDTIFSRVFYLSTSIFSFYKCPTLRLSNSFIFLYEILFILRLGSLYNLLRSLNKFMM